MVSFPLRRVLEGGLCHCATLNPQGGSASVAIPQLDAAPHVSTPAWAYDPSMRESHAHQIYKTGGLLP